MNRQQIQEIILRVLLECGELGNGREIPFDIPVEVSAKHVHLTQEAVEKLFGAGASLTPKRPLSQPGQFLSEERVTLITPKGRMENVAVLGPVRDAIQTELAMTDCRALGLNAPLRMSGDLSGAADIYMMGTKGMIEAKGSVIVAQAHVHLTPQDAERAGVIDGQRVSVTIHGKRQTTFEQVLCRVSSQAALAMHIDFDEANACMLPKSATARMRIVMEEPTAGIKTVAEISEQKKIAVPERTDTGIDRGRGREEPEAAEPPFEGKLITEAVARRLAADRRTPVVLAKGVIVTPSAKDVLRYAGIDVLWQNDQVCQSGRVQQSGQVQQSGRVQRSGQVWQSRQGGRFI